MQTRVLCYFCIPAIVVAPILTFGKAGSPLLGACANVQETRIVYIATEQYHSNPTSVVLRTSPSSAETSPQVY